MQSNGNVGFTINSGRGTLDLIWSCLVTIVLCTWKVQRLQFLPWTLDGTTVFRRKAFWFIITLICPEYIVWIAFEQWCRARGYQEVQKLGYSDWTMRHGFYIDMGCFQVELKGKSASLPAGKENSDIIELDDCFRFTIRLEDLISLIKADLLSAPDISTHELDERNQNDQFARVITSLQVLYFVSQFFGRLGYNLPISNLELSTIAFVCSAVLIEYFWWNKPLDLRTGTVVKLDAEKNEQFISLFPELRFNTPEQNLAEWGKGDFALFFDRLKKSNINMRFAYGLLTAVLINSIHISVWNNSFPSETEQLLWQITSTGACGAIFLLWFGTNIRAKTIKLVICSLSTMLYWICRVYLIIAVFVGLRSVPEALYQTVSWLNVLPGV